MKTISIDTVQKSQLSEKDYSKAWLVKLIEEMTPDQVSLFCREIAHLNHFYCQAGGAIVTDQNHFKITNPEQFWELDTIDFNDPITFKQIE